MEDHTLLTYLALDDLSLPGGREEIEVQSLDDFIDSTRTDLQQFLDNLEHALSKEVPGYPPLPEKLRFYSEPRAPEGPNESGASKTADTAETPELLKNWVTQEESERLFCALRVNPGYRPGYYIKLRPKMEHTQWPEGKAELAFEDITPYHHNYPYSRFYPVEPGEKVKPVEVLAAGADEPDYGLDLGLFEDNGTDYGSLYGFGPQPFGDPTQLRYSQAPLHMGFFHAPWTVYAAHPGYKSSLVQTRVLQFAALGAFAFSRGYPYWGYRFTGWGLHYVQDLTMPYHVCLAPGLSHTALARIGLLKAAGITGPFNRLLQRTVRKHILLEMLQLERVNTLSATGRNYHSLIQGIKGTNCQEQDFSPAGLIDIVAKNAHSRARKIGQALDNVIKDQEIFENIHDFYEQKDYDIYRLCHGPGTQEFDTFQNSLTEILTETGRHSRGYIRWSTRSTRSGFLKDSLTGL